MKLDEDLKQELIDIIRQDGELPDSFRNVLFPPKDGDREPELQYTIKEKKESVLEDTRAMPFQMVRQFGEVQKGDWQNRLIFGENLQILKFLKKEQEEGNLEKFKLIFIDPPFGTGDTYDARGAPAYSATLQGIEFIEFIRKRLMFLREILADDGSIYLRIDYHYGHYVKILMDEIFGKNNFRNEIVVNRRKKSSQDTNKFNVSTEIILFYSKSENFVFHKGTKSRTCSFCGHVKEPEWHVMISSGFRNPPERVILNRKLLPPKGYHWTYSQKNIDKMTGEGRIKLDYDSSYTDMEGNKIDCMPFYLQSETVPIDANWTDIYGYTSKWKYPTENPEELLFRVIDTSSDRNDLVLDCFAGSGTTGVVAEKLGRRWVMADSSKLSIYTIIKRLHNMRKEIKNEGKPLEPRPFTLMNSGLYEDHDYINIIGEDNFRKFSIDLFQAVETDDEINGLKVDGILLDSPVIVFSREGFLTESYVKELHDTVRGHLKSRMFIIAPTNRVDFLQDYIEKEGIRYYVLRIPNSLIDELNKKDFVSPFQQTTADEMNQNIKKSSFDFINPPNVAAVYARKNSGDKLIDNELVIRIEEFEAVQRSKDPVIFDDPMDALGMVIIDRDYNGKYFNMTDYYFPNDLKKNGYEIAIHPSGTGESICVIYMDVLGNERIEVKKQSEFMLEND